MANTPPVSRRRIAMAHDQPIFAIGVTTVLARHGGFEVVGHATTTDEALTLARQLAPDVLLVDHRPPRLSGVDLARRLQLAGSATRLIILATKMPDAQIQRALLNGAWGVVAKATAADALPGCVTQVMKGERWIGIDSVDPLVRSLVQAPATRSASLTAREAEIVHSVATGASNKQIASKLRMGEQTVKNGLRRIFKKLQVANRMGLALLAMEEQVGTESRARRQPANDRPS